MSKDYKRLLAYSSIEHMGIIAVGFGFGGFWGTFGALFHMLNHALTKSLLFFGAGRILQRFRTKDIGEVHGIIKALPFTGALFLGGALAITGCPPFSLFLSEFMVLVGGLYSQSYLGAVVYMVLLPWSSRPSYITWEGWWSVRPERPRGARRDPGPTWC
jgi:hydrogenase-4 component F